jgi:hypothetical protein
MAFGPNVGAFHQQACDGAFSKDDGDNHIAKGFNEMEAGK